MAYYSYRRNWRRPFPRRGGYWTRRLWTRAYHRRRRGYYRTYRRRWRPVRRKRNYHPRKHWVPVPQWNPSNKRWCTIRGYMPLLFCVGAPAGCAVFNYPQKTVSDWKGGGVHSSVFSLADLYQEETEWRCRWSGSNQGFNLCRYYGGTLCLWPNATYSYIFWYSVNDPEPDNLPLRVCHPSQMLVQPRHIVVTRASMHRNMKPIKVRIPPPATLAGNWYSMKDMCQKTLFKWRVSLIDMEQTWTGFPDGHAPVSAQVFACRPGQEALTQTVLSYYPWLDDGNNVNISEHTMEFNQTNSRPTKTANYNWPIEAQFRKLLLPFYMWGFGFPTEYYIDSYQWHLPAPHLDSHNKNVMSFIFLSIKAGAHQWKGFDTTNVYYVPFSTLLKIVCNAPWVEKSIQQPGVNVTMMYKFYFQWGGKPGSKLPPVTPCDPSAADYKPIIEHPYTYDAEVPGPGDYDSDGIIREGALRRLTRSNIPTDARKLSRSALHQSAIAAYRTEHGPSSGESEQEEEDTPYLSCSSEESQKDTPSSSVRQRLRERLGRMDRHRLHRILRLLKSGHRIHTSTHHSGRERSSSI
ncbi:putative ORF1 [Rodent Torque teno virus 7]|uniref:Capsid protein n=1 Tax=Rodent Torque teno virus 7 TaxID=2054614 RepID=A0A2H4QBC6_9VIRU|nr:putative ORF1 [Rodent Torque teno virus 7]ATX61876.1 putative ORF1 [Rodent Torque teno virus 7]